MAFTPKKVSELTAASSPVADTATVAGVQMGASRKITAGQLRQLASYALAGLPTTGVGAGSMAYCTDASGGAVPVYYDGTNWKRFDTNATVS